MTNTNNESIIIYEEKFTPSNLPTGNLVDELIEKYQLPNNESTKIALGSYMAYGPNKFKVKEGKYDIEILLQLLKFGVLFKYPKEENTYRLWLPNSLLSFRTVKTDKKKPRVTTEYGSTYNDGSHDEVPENLIKTIH
ncbi:hypothetical protein [Paracoccus fistulariae]|uniref:Uncharacterized protein n=1 Tax=Paracoccus fistulariae TaxID=658446 RepID=A0ABY7SL79_9RHOB|nr:hypothetical protein [Paracoccus fistulariae]MDB6181976.1 hypothetical protein [Paracoccus fistulariae]WCR06787.1 hypothetical protein JHX87_15110 [Paracoccus fistulariae]